ncbi:hypothetical protein MRX96_051476 [Rhipicephalus microplus]
MHLLLVFIMSHCFTGGYISFLNKPTMEEVPDTKEKLLAFLRKGRLEPCVVRNMFEHMFILIDKDGGDWTDRKTERGILETHIATPEHCGP